MITQIDPVKVLASRRMNGGCSALPRAVRRYLWEEENKYQVSGRSFIDPAQAVTPVTLS